MRYPEGGARKEIRRRPGGSWIAGAAVRFTRTRGAIKGNRKPGRIAAQVPISRKTVGDCGANRATKTNGFGSFNE